ncbi:hypothetical protein SAMN06297280_0108 [Arsukibacterium tuosuense]|uniref:Uncharacterized protein n=1 Tax=Arsukibacterium tuosuense TaxID=1323745 RepID=A0A285JL08_9GAMM|nr:hypothetical protein [Arsukibacterium tuosuense]SNY60497.1 hypothetical protein SAMN06297280_0108 [Arsukibacterium tuosuense]
MSKILIALLFTLLATTTHASQSKLNLSCHLIPLDYPGFSLNDIQDKAISLTAADATAKPLFNANDHTFIVSVSRMDITDVPYILDFYLEIQPPAPAAPVRAYSASYFSPGTGKHHARLELLHYGDTAEPYPSGQLVFECWQYE